MKIICVGRNYALHAKELGNTVPSNPLIFMKPDSALLQKNRPFYYPEFSKDIHYEVEVVLKICKNGRHVQKEFASSYYEKVGLGIDFTARDIQQQCKEKGHPWEIAKGFDSSAVLGQFVDKSSLDQEGIVFGLDKNNEQAQIGNTKDMLFSFDDIIAYVSQFFFLKLGDLIYTGTPAGVGPIAIGDQLNGWMEVEGEKREMFACQIR